MSYFITIDKFSKLTLEVPQNTVLSAITISLSSDFLEPNLLVLGQQYTKNLVGTTLTIEPDKVWIEGLTITVGVPNMSTRKYIVPSTRKIYAPEQRLYSLDRIDDLDPYGSLRELGLLNTEEKELLDNLTPNLESVVYDLSRNLVTEFVYNRSAPVKKLTIAKGFRRMQQLVHMFGLSSLLEFFVISPGPNKEWFESTHIVNSLSDSNAISNYSDMVPKIDRLYNKMLSLGLDVEMIHSVDYQVDPNNEFNKILKGIITVLIAIRYNNDNTQFSY